MSRPGGIGQLSQCQCPNYHRTPSGEYAICSFHESFLKHLSPNFGGAPTLVLHSVISCAGGRGSRFLNAVLCDRRRENETVQVSIPWYTLTVIKDVSGQRQALPNLLPLALTKRRPEISWHCPTLSTIFRHSPSCICVWRLNQSLSHPF